MPKVPTVIKAVDLINPLDQVNQGNNWRINPKNPETDGFFNIPTEPKKGVKEIEKEIEIENEKMTCLLFGFL